LYAYPPPNGLIHIPGQVPISFSFIWTS
jgi:hypothetical protein